MNWLKLWLGRGVSITRKISWPDASQDKCKACGKTRETHEKSVHRFVEKEFQ